MRAKMEPANLYEKLVERYKEEIICKACNGVGKLASCEATTYRGRTEVNRTIRNCEECYGNGVSRPFITGKE